MKKPLEWIAITSTVGKESSTGAGECEEMRALDAKIKMLTRQRTL